MSTGRSLVAALGVGGAAAAARAAVCVGRDQRARRRLPTTRSLPAQVALTRLDVLPVPVPRAVRALGRRLGWSAGDIRRRWSLAVGAWAVAVGSALLVSGVGLAALVAVVIPLVAKSLAAALIRRQTVQIDAALPLLLDELARSLRTGASLGQALVEASGSVPGRVGDDLRVLRRTTEHGATLSDALEQWAESRPGTGVALVVTALLVGMDTGGASARAVDGVAMTLRERLAVSAEVRALASQSRLSAVVMSVAPLGFCVLLVGADKAAADFLLRSPIGLACLAAGLGLDGVAALWMSKMARVDP